MVVYNGKSGLMKEKEGGQGVSETWNMGAAVLRSHSADAAATEPHSVNGNRLDSKRSHGIPLTFSNHVLTFVPKPLKPLDQHRQSTNPATVVQPADTNMEPEGPTDFASEPVNRLIIPQGLNGNNRRKQIDKSYTIVLAPLVIEPNTFHMPLATQKPNDNDDDAAADQCLIGAAETQTEGLGFVFCTALKTRIFPHKRRHPVALSVWEGREVYITCARGNLAPSTDIPAN